MRESFKLGSKRPPVRAVLLTILFLAAADPASARGAPDPLSRLNFTPASGSRTGRDFTLTGNTGLGAYTVRINGENVERLNAFRFSYTFHHLSKGVHTNTVTVTDRSGNTLRGVYCFTVTNGVPRFMTVPSNPVVHCGNFLNLKASASDPDGDALTCTWKQLSGPAPLPGVPAGGASFGLTAPYRSGRYVLEVTASDGAAAVSMRIPLTVTNLPPAVRAHWVVIASHGRRTDLSVNASDPDADFLHYRWETLSGPAPVDLPNPDSPAVSFTAPDVMGIYTFRCTATDGEYSASDDIIVPVTNRPPVIRSVSSGTKLAAGTQARLDVEADDPEGDALSFSWRQVSGPAAVTLRGANTSNAAFTAPAVTGTYIFEVSASDGLATAGGNPSGGSLLSTQVAYTIRNYAVIYLAQGGTGSGLSAASPVGRLDKAFALAKTNDAIEIRISGNPAVGHDPVLTLVTNLAVTGGWNAAFTRQGAPSVLDGLHRCSNIMEIRGCPYLTLSNLVLKGANDCGLSISEEVLWSEPGYQGHRDDYPSSHCRVWVDILSNDNAGLRIYGDDNVFHGNVCGNGQERGVSAVDLWGNRNAFYGNVSGNRAYRGSGIYLSGEHNTVRAVVTGNKAEYDGGGIILHGDFNTFDGTVAGNYAGHWGGGLFVTGNGVTVRGTISNNSAYRGAGGMYLSGMDNAVDASIRGNSTLKTDLDDYATGAGSSGGGLYLAGSRNTVSGDVTGNSAGETRVDKENTGGGICVIGNSNAFRCAILSNRSHSGGGIDVEGNGNVFSGVVSGNTATFGGGMYVSGTLNRFVMPSVSGNRARLGGGVYIVGTYNVFTCTIADNAASEHGGGVYSYNGASRDELPNGIVENTVTNNVPDNTYVKLRE